MTTRRDFLMQCGVVTSAAVAAAAVPAIVAPAALAMVKPRRVDLARVHSYDVMTAAYQNAIVDRINELSEAIR